MPGSTQSSVDVVRRMCIMKSARSRTLWEHGHAIVYAALVWIAPSFTLHQCCTPSLPLRDGLLCRVPWTMATTGFVPGSLLC